MQADQRSSVGSTIGRGTQVSQKDTITLVRYGVFSVRRGMLTANRNFVGDD